MKKSILILTAMVAMVMFGCKETPYMSAPGENEFVPDSMPVIVDPDPSPDPEGVYVPEDAITVYEACAIARKLHGSQISDRKYFIKGWVTNFDAKGRGDEWETDFPQYGNDYVHMSATAPDAPVASRRDFYAYRVLGKFGAKLPDHDCIHEGDFIIISCYITNFGGTFESSGACFIYSSSNDHFNETFPFQVAGSPELKECEIDVTEAERVAIQVKKDKPNDKYPTTDETYNVRGVVVGLDSSAPDNYGSLNFTISDGMSYAKCYQTYCKTANGKFTNINQVAVGDTVMVIGKIENFNGTCEPYRGYVAESTNPNF